MTVLYHYTNRIALEAIVNQKLLRPSLRRNRPNDVRYGNGQYLSDIPPGTLDAEQLSRLLVGHPNEAYRLTHFIAIDVSGLPVQRGRSGVFVIPGNQDLDITGRIKRSGLNANDLPQSFVET